MLNDFTDSAHFKFLPWSVNLLTSMGGRKLKTSSNDELVINPKTSRAALSGHSLMEFNILPRFYKHPQNSKVVNWFKLIFTLIVMSRESPEV